MKSLLKGIASFDHILTEEDVLRFNGANIEPDEVPASVEDAPKPDAPKPDAPKPDAPKPDAPKPDAPKPDAPKPDAPKPDDVPLSDGELAAKLEAENTKAALVVMAEAAGVDQSGNKAELSARLVAHYRAQK